MDGLTVRQDSSSPARILSPSSTMSPAMIAFVVAIAGIMLPAMAGTPNSVKPTHVFNMESQRETNLHLTSKRLFMFMLKMYIRRLAAAVTKSMEGGSSWQDKQGLMLTRQSKLKTLQQCISKVEKTCHFVARHISTHRLSYNIFHPTPSAC